jgi:hypothetical protein
MRVGEIVLFSAMAALTMALVLSAKILPEEERERPPIIIEEVD